MSEPSSVRAPSHRPDDAIIPLIGWAVVSATVVGLATGLAQVASQAWHLFVRSEMIWESRDFAWMVPLSYVLQMVAAALGALAVALLLARLVARTRIRVQPRRVVAFVTTALGALALLLMVGRLHQLAQLLLACGVATSASALLARVSTRTLARAALASMLPIVLIGAGARIARERTERLAAAAIPAPPPGAPNVLLLILDTVRASSMSLYGNPRETTPALERWAKDGATFDMAVSTGPWTLVSHAGMFTGRAEDSTSATWRTPLDGRYRTLAEALRDHGWMTGGFVANTAYTGWDSGLARGFVHYEDYRTTPKQVYWASRLSQTGLARSLLWGRGVRSVLDAVRRFDLSTPQIRIVHRKPGTLVSDEFLAWQRQLGTRPFFAFLNYFDAHDPYEPSRRRRATLPAKPSNQELYAAGIRTVDDEIDRVLTTLRARGTLDNTIVIVSADHGEYLGEHDRWGHGNGLHLEVLNVPLVVRYPTRVPRGVRVEQVVTLADLASTVLDLAGVREDRIPGRSLARAWTGGETPSERIVARASTTYMADGWLPPARQRRMEAKFSQELHWIRTAEGEEVYAYRGDPGELHDLSTDAALRARADSLFARRD